MHNSNNSSRIQIKIIKSCLFIQVLIHSFTQPSNSSSNSKHTKNTIPQTLYGTAIYAGQLGWFFLGVLSCQIRRTCAPGGSSFLHESQTLRGSKAVKTSAGGGAGTGPTDRSTTPKWKWSAP